MRPLAESEVLSLIASGETASNLLNQADPNLRKRFRRLCRGLVKLMQDTKKHFTDAEYYTGGDHDIHLMLGKAHNDKTELPQTELVADTYSRICIGDGGW